MAWVLAGTAAGVPAALLATLAIQRGIPGAKPYDPLVLSAMIALLGAASLLANYFPARRAARVHPVVALRCE
jgi:ABC-type antimicrobial peptide transport system permease subunit